MLGPCHVTRMRIQAALLKAAIDEGSSWHLALEVRSLHEEGHEPGPHMSLVHMYSMQALQMYHSVAVWCKRPVG